MNNQQFLDCIQEAFVTFLNTGSRSNEKLKVLHGAIAADLAQSLNLNDEYTVKSLGYPFRNSSEECIIKGRYTNKKVDITVLGYKEIELGIAVKFVMQSYQKNANNYFESMLGETANIQSVNIPYFQIFIIPYKLPRYKKGKFDGWDYFDDDYILKYKNLSSDSRKLPHIPTGILLYIIDLSDDLCDIGKPEDPENYKELYKKLNEQGKLSISCHKYSQFDESGKQGNVIYNNYEQFLDMVIKELKRIRFEKA